MCIFFRKRHCYDFYKNVIIVQLLKEYLTDSVKIKLPSVELRIFADSLIKFARKNCEKYMEKQVYHFFLNGVYIRLHRQMDNPET